MAQSTDSLVLKEQILLQENKRYIQMAQYDNVISSTQADSLRRLTSGSIEKHIPFFFGSRAWYKGKVTFINGHEVPVPSGDPRR